MSRRVLNGLDLTNQRIINLGDPSGIQDAATKSYVDATARGLDWKASVRAASTGNVSITSAPSTVDGVTLAAGDRLLLKDQTAGTENGIRVFTAAAAALARTSDADTNAEVTSGLAVSVTEGSVNDNRVYVLTTNDPITLDTTALAFTQLGGASASYIGGAGLLLTGSTFDVGAGVGVTVAADSIGIDTSVVTRKYAANVGNGSLTAVAVVHNLGTRDVQVAVYDSTTFEEVWPDVVRTDVNTVTLTFATAPAAAAYRAVIQG